ncbi:hypothetical protein [Amycolatopsis sacchari]|uniref:Uncharacterized protein n=1 Tax=Amycolatopsis sacchari TaxID=115433 RepID=A0A1I4D0T7_9PSEU|nr:hypothetical protein [Amycolatopsis sacchari]SFK86329.1 hypothetical protein SAMN05421835_13921 [Amycolatopsis sacchari]
MLYIVLILVLAALGLLVTALITASSLWAWASIALSVLAGLVLVADFVRRRAARRRPARAVEPSEPEPSESPDPDDEVEEPAGDETELLRVTGELDEEQTPVVQTGDPAVEPTSPEDAEAVAKLDVEVLVVDEYPRYHVAECTWLADRDTIPISVKEARDLGFTPCVRCTPDAKLLSASKSR